MLPASYAWQVHGWGAAAAVFLVLYALLVAAGWLTFFREWPFRWLVAARIALAALAFIVIGISAVEHCDVTLQNCRRAFFSN